jgi:nitrogen regulatory protein PII
MANSQRNKTFWVSTEVANAALNQAGFEALTWVQVGGVGSIGETGISTNPISYNTLETEVTDKAKGM